MLSVYCNLCKRLVGTHHRSGLPHWRNLSGSAFMKCELMLATNGDTLSMALMIRWQPFKEMETLRRQMDQIFDEMVNVNREAQMT